MGSMGGDAPVCTLLGEAVALYPRRTIKKSTQTYPDGSASCHGPWPKYLTSMKNKVTSHVSFNLPRSPLRKPLETKTDRSTQWSVYCCAVSNGTETRSQWVSIRRQIPSKFCYPYATFHRAISKMNDLELPVGGFVCHVLWSKTLRCKTVYLFFIKRSKIKLYGHISIWTAVWAWRQNTGSWDQVLSPSLKAVMSSALAT